MQKAYEDGRVIQVKPGAVPRYKRYLDEMPGVPVMDCWDDIGCLQGGQCEFLGYPTQKPVALLERIIRASSNPGDVILDPFCRCGTAVHAAQKLGCQWIGIDISHLAVALIQSQPACGVADGSCFTALETRNFARELGVECRFTPVRSPQSNGMAESFVKTFKRD